MPKWITAQLFEGIWWKLYLKRKNERYLECKRKYWINILKMIPGIEPVPANVLDVGCGPSGIFMVLNDHHVTAIDPLLENYNKKLVLFSMENYPWVDFIPAKIEDFTPDEKFDLIFCMNSINHFDDLQLAMFRLSELVKRQGILIFTVDVHNYRFFKYLLKITGVDIMHPYQMSGKDYILIFKKYGFKVNRWSLLKSRFMFNHCLFVAEKIK